MCANSFSQVKMNMFSSDMSISHDSIPAPDLINSPINGIFISPMMGLEFPVPKFINTAKNGFTYGIKLEYANYNLYPVIIGLMYQGQTNSGDDNYITANLLNNLSTKISSFGVTMDFILNKYFKYQFTIPFMTLELKYLSITRSISPTPNNTNLSTSDNTFGITAGFGFTLNIFDVYGTYTYAKDYSSAGIKTRIHYPLIKF